MGSNLMTAAKRWAREPKDNRFWSVADLGATETERKARCRVAGVNGDLDLRVFSAVSVDNDVCLRGPRGGNATMTNHAFNQLCGLTQAPREFLSLGDLPPALACEVLNFSIQRQPLNVQMLTELVTDTFPVVRCFTSPQYTRIWDADVCEFLNRRGQGWVTPPARPAHNDDPRNRPATESDVVAVGAGGGAAVKVGDMIGPAGIYKGDRDSFMFLIQPQTDVDDGGSHLVRGMFIHNSEVRNNSLEIMQFMLEGVCGNHICWGVSEFSKVRIIHRGDKADNRWREELSRALRISASADVAPELAMIAKAKAHVLAKPEEMVAYLFGLPCLRGKISKTDIEAAWQFAQEWEPTACAAPNTAWGYVHGLTRYSQTKAYAGDRHDLDMVGGKILALAI